jgi:hypothetical protein
MVDFLDIIYFYADDTERKYSNYDENIKVSNVPVCWCMDVGWKAYMDCKWVNLSSL